MSPASAQLAERIAGISVSMPAIPVVHNCNVSVAESVEEIAQNLVTQLDSPVRWVECVQAIHRQGVDTFIESGPGRVLGGMIKRIAAGSTVACLEKPNVYQDLINA